MNRFLTLAYNYCTIVNMNHLNSGPEIHGIHQTLTSQLAGAALIAIREPFEVIEALARPAESHKVRDHALGIIQSTVGALITNSAELR